MRYAQSVEQTRLPRCRIFCPEQASIAGKSRPLSPRHPTADTNSREPIMKKIISAAVFAMAVSMAAFAQQPAPTTAGPAEIFTRLPVGTTVTNFYKQPVYDSSDNKMRDVDDVLIDKEGRITAMIIGVGGFLGMGEKDVAVSFSSVRASEKNNKWYLVLNTNKEALQ